MAVKRLSCLILLVLLSGCAVLRTEDVRKIALLAPFEGQYREIGYNALYSARLAIADSGTSNIDLLAIDDGGRIETATARIEAIKQDPSVALVIALGIYSTSQEAQMALDGMQMLIVGHWNTTVASESTFMLSNPRIDALLNFTDDVTTLSETSEPIRGSEILSLEQVPLLLDDLSQIQIYSSASLPDADFRERYLNSAEFAPEPNLLAQLSYDATRLALQAIQSNTPITDIHYEGLHDIEFEDGYWLTAPIHEYVYDGSTLINTD